MAITIEIEHDRLGVYRCVVPPTATPRKILLFAGLPAACLPAVRITGGSKFVQRQLNESDLDTPLAQLSLAAAPVLMVYDETYPNATPSLRRYRADYGDKTPVNRVWRTPHPLAR